MAVTVGEIVKILTEWAPVSLKESWDNPGLLVGSPDEPVQKIMVTLDVMRDSVDYAVAHGVNLIVSHHPIISAASRPCAAIRTTETCIRSCWPIIFPCTARTLTWTAPTAG